MKIEDKFHDEMKKIYLKAKEEAHYPANRFIQMVSNDGGLETAKKLIMKEGGSDGFTNLWERNRLDLTVEALVIRAEFASLFSEEEIKICKERLKKYGYENL